MSTVIEGIWAIAVGIGCFFLSVGVAYKIAYAPPVLGPCDSLGECMGRRLLTWLFLLAVAAIGSALSGYLAARLAPGAPFIHSLVATLCALCILIAWDLHDAKWAISLATVNTMVRLFVVPVTIFCFLPAGLGARAGIRAQQRDKKDGFYSN